MNKTTAWMNAAACLVALWASLVCAAETHSPLTAHLFSPRAAGMGGAHAAVETGEAGAEGWNPATLRPRHPFEMSAEYVHDRYGKVNTALLFAAAPERYLAYGGMACLYDTRKIDLNSVGGREAFATTPRTILIALTGACRLEMLENSIDLGCNLKLLSSAGDDQTTTTRGALDLGIRFELVNLLDELYFGMALKNLGFMQDPSAADILDEKPEYVLAGLVYDLFRSDRFHVLVASDARYSLTKHWTGNFGLEVRIADWLAVRGGYQTGFDRGGGLGIGFFGNAAQFEYAVSLPVTSRSIHSIGLEFKIGPQWPDAVFPDVAGPEAHAANSGESEVSAAVSILPAGPIQKIVLQNSHKKICADIIGVQRVGGRATDVVLNAGAKQQVQEGCVGMILNLNGLAVAGVRVWEVHPDYSYATVVTCGHDIEKKARAIIELSR